MIIKKMKNKRPEKSKAAHIADTQAYIDAIDTPEDGKVLFTGALNVRSSNRDEQRLEMIRLAEKSTRSKNPMNHFVMSLQVGEDCTKQQAELALNQLLNDLGYKGCQVLYAVHQNTNNIHIHAMINRVDPETYKARSDAYDIEKIHRSIAKIEAKTGWKGERHARYVMIDGEPMQAVYVDNSQEITISDKARAFEIRQGEKSLQRIAAEEAIPILESSKTWQELHERMAGIGLTYEKKGGGCIIRSIMADGDSTEIKPSSLARWASLKNMEKRLGAYEPPNCTPTPRQPEPMPGIPQDVFTAYQELKAEAKRQAEDAKNKAYEEFKAEMDDLKARRVETIEVLKNADMDWSQKECALYAIQKAAKEIYREDLKALTERYKKTIEKGKMIQPRATEFEVWLKHNVPDRSNEIIAKLEQSSNSVYISNEQVVSHDMTTKLRLFDEYHQAVQADRYRITSKSNADAKLAIIFDKVSKNAPSYGYTPEEVRRCIGMMNPNLIRKRPEGMSFFETERLENVYFTPLSDDKWHFFIDDMDSFALLKMKTDGLTPAAIIKSSPGNWQAIFTLKRVGLEHEKQIINDLAMGLNVRYGDVNFCGAIHPHRAPGFWNTKPKHFKVNEGYPICTIQEASGVMCPVLTKYVQEISDYYDYQQSKKTKIYQQSAYKEQTIDKRQTNLELTKNSLQAIKVFEAHRQAVMKIAGVNEETQDKSRVDKAVCLRLVVTGHKREEIEAMVKTYRLHKGYGKFDLDDYARRTVDYAFGVEGIAEIEQFKKWHGQWKAVEYNAIHENFKTITPESEGPHNVIRHGQHQRMADDR